MATELATAYLSLVPSLKGGAKSIGAQLRSGAVRAEASSAGESIGSALVASAAKALAKITVAIGAVKGAVRALGLQGGIARQLQIENAESKLTGLGHSAAATAAIMGDAMASVKGTAYSMGDAATMAATAVAAGVQPGKDLQRYLSLVGDAATIAGVSMGEMGQIFGKVQTQGRAYTMELNQLADRGIPIYQWLADEYKVNTVELRKMVAAGKVDAATYQKVIEQHIGGAALTMGSTTQGAFANMKAASARFGVELTKWAFPLAKNVFNAVTSITDAVTATIKPFTTAFADAFTSKVGPQIDAFATRATVALGKVAAGLSLLHTGDFTAEIGQTLNVGEDAPLVDTLLRVRDGLVRVHDAVSAATGSVRYLLTGNAAALAGVTNTGFIDQLVHLRTTAKDATTQVRDGLGAMWAGLTSTSTHATRAGLAGAFEHVGILARTTAEEVVDGAKAMWAAFQSGGTDVTSTGLAGLMESIGLVARTLWDAIGPTIKTLAPSVLSLATAFSPLGIVLNGVTPVLPVLGQALANIATAVGGVLAQVLPVLADALRDVGTALAGAITQALPAIVPLFETLAEVVPLLTPALVTLIPLVASLAVGAINLAAPLLANENVVKALAVGFLAWKAAVAGIALKGMIAGLVTSTSTLWANTTAWASNTSAKIASKALTVAIVALYVKDWLVAVARSTGALALNTAGWLRNTASLVAHKAAAVATAVASRTMAAAQAAVTAAQWAMNAALNANPIGIVIAAVAALVGALVWLYQNNETVRAGITAVWSGIKSAIGAVASWWTDTAWPAIKRVVDAFGAGFQAAGQVISTAWEGIRAGAASAWAWIERWVINPIKLALAAVGAVFEIQKNIWTGAFVFVRDGLKTVWDWIGTHVFEPFKIGIGLIGTAFDNVATGIGKAWDGIKKAAAAPINFVLGTVYNDGIRAWWNTVAGAVGLNSLKLPEAKTIAFETGGVTPGFTPGRDIHRFYSPTGGRLDLSGGEAIMRPEWTRLAGGPAAVAAMNAAARAGRLLMPHQAFADGGVWGWVGGIAGDAWEGIKAAGRGIWDAAGMAVEILKDPIGAVRKAVVEGIIEPKLAASGVAGDLIRVVGALPSRFADGLGQKIKDLIGTQEKAVGINGPPVGAGMGVAAMTQALHALLPGARVTSGSRPGAVSVTGAKSMHALNRALDIGAGNGYSLSQIWDTLNAAYGTKSFQLLYTPKGAQQIWWNHVRSQTPASIQRTHNDHVHWAMRNGGVLPKLFDTGGWLHDGQLGLNLTGKPEAVLTPEESAALKNGLGSNPGPTVQIGQIVAANPREAFDEMERAMRRERVRAGLLGRPW